ncbi:MAG: prepilin-type N-terminal cleavage/methylation domain-containing protein [Phycisphaerales bacterium JB054]
MTNAKAPKGAQRGPRGFTLIECLAVVALLALAVATLATGLAPSAAEAHLRNAASAVLDLDARARALAMQGEHVVLRALEGRASVRVGNAAMFERELPRAIEVVLTEPGTGTPLDGVRIDTRGRSIDYALSLHAGDRRTQMLVSGLTGYAFAETGP